MTKIREIQSGGYHVKSVEAPSSSESFRFWLIEQAQTFGIVQLLAHADDGVIWGWIEDGQLLTSGAMFDGGTSPSLRLETLQQARLFGEAGELLLWCSDGGWRARWVTDVREGEGYYEETQILWGNRHETTEAGFTLVCEGRAGLRHAPPVEITPDAFDEDGRSHPLRLQVRHYLETDIGTGLVRVTLSRLVEVRKEEQP